VALVNTNYHWLKSLPVIVAVVNDLMFGARIRAAAEHAQATCIFARTPAALHEHAAGAALVLLDLETRWLDAPAEISRLKAEATTVHVPVVAFGSHVLGDVLRAAQAAGAERVLARSAFVQALPDLVRGSV
jgi:CheY-like chemotaxis protein